MIRNFIALVGVLAVSVALAQDAAGPTLKAGDPAPALATGKWIKGDAVEKFEKGKVYVIEFWSSWAAQCRVSIPHLTRMQDRYKDVTFVGQDVWERNPAAVAPFIKLMGDDMNYRIALDEPSGEQGKMALTWMQAAGQESVPCAFVIDKDAKIAWIGPSGEMDHVVRRVAAGTFDAKEEAQLVAARTQLERDLKRATRYGDAEKAMQLIDEAIKANPDLAEEFAPAKFIVMVNNGDAAGAMAYANQIYDVVKDDPDSLNSIAWTIVDPQGPKIKNPDLALAEKMALHACELTRNQNAALLDTLARVYFVKGDTAKAIETQSKAVEKADGDLKQQLQKTLETYKTKAQTI